MSFSLRLNNDTVRTQQSVTSLAIANMKSGDEDPKGREGVESQSPDLRHQASSLQLVQGAGSWDHTGAALKGKEDEETWKVLGAASSKRSKIANPV